jgi:tyrosyl-tRNA synthetase
MESLDSPPNIAIILGILPGTDGVIKMSKSLGNHIPLNTSPEDMYGKVMSVPDAAMGDYFRLVTRWTPAEIKELERNLEGGELHPRDVKMKLAREIIAIYHGEDAVEPAEAEFKRVFQQGDLPEDMPEIEIRSGASLVDVMVEAELAKSKSAARRLIDQRGVRLDDEVVEDSGLILDLESSIILRVGKRRFARLIAS